jgi:hypothetical protein
VECVEEMESLKESVTVMEASLTSVECVVVMDPLVKKKEVVQM